MATENEYVIQIEKITAVSEARRKRVAELEAEIERLHQVCRNVYEVWAGSEGLPLPETAPEAYLRQLITKMVDEAKEGLK